MKKIRIGSGAGFAGDRLDPALHLMRSVDLDYIAFECLAERTIALAQLQKLQNPHKGYDPLLDYRMRHVLPIAAKKGVRILSNMGGSNPKAALQHITELAQSTRLSGMKFAAVLGDDVLEQVLRNPDLKQLENGRPVKDIFPDIISANAYLGAGPLVEALANGAHLILTGRVADPSLFLAPLLFEFGWQPDSWDLMGKGTMIGHLLECAGQLSGGYFAGSFGKAVPDLWNLGFPYAEVNELGEGFVSKAPGTGGLVSTATCTEQLLYEIHDPARYLTPDCTADFSEVNFKPIASDCIAFSGATGTAATDSYKVSVGYRNGFLADCQISYGGSDALVRAEMAADIVRKRLKRLGIEVSDLRTDFIGCNAINPLTPNKSVPPREVRLRVAARALRRSDAELFTHEVESLYTNGPYGGGGVVKRIQEVVSITSVLLPKAEVPTKVIYQTI